MIPIAKPILGKEEEQAILEVIASGQLVQGPRVREFETCFAELCGAKYAVATSSGTAALQLAMLAHEIGPADEVITSPFSFIASANCAFYVGARPVFVDIEPEFFTIDPAKVEERITERTKAIIPVHLYGQACDMDAIHEIAQKHHLIIVEDACQAHGALYKNRPVGSWGTACYSLYASKNITTVEGGMLVTSDPEIAERARMIRSHGSSIPYEHVMLGYNMRLTDLAAAIGLIQLRNLQRWNSLRQQNAAYLTDKLSKIDGIVTPKIRDQAKHVFHQYTIRIADRDQAAQKLREKGVGVGIHYPTPIHHQPLYRKLGYRDHLPVAEAASRQVLSLPVHPSLTSSDLDCIVQAIASL
jgi:dTDP-4-amino-4,6-dideoxygalactose transaminase